MRLNTHERRCPWLCRSFDGQHTRKEEFDGDRCHCSMRRSVHTENYTQSTFFKTHDSRKCKYLAEGLLRKEQPLVGEQHHKELHLVEALLHRD